MEICFVKGQANRLTELKQKILISYDNFFLLNLHKNSINHTFLDKYVKHLKQNNQA